MQILPPCKYTAIKLTGDTSVGSPATPPLCGVQHGYVVSVGW